MENREVIRIDRMKKRASSFDFDLVVTWLLTWAFLCSEYRFCAVMKSQFQGYSSRDVQFNMDTKKVYKGIPKAEKLISEIKKKTMLEKNVKTS